MHMVYQNIRIKNLGLAVHINGWGHIGFAWNWVKGQKNHFGGGVLGLLKMNFSCFILI